MSRNNSIYSKVVQSKGIKVNVSANGGLSASVCHWSKVNRGVTCGEFRTNIKLFFRKINKEIKTSLSLSSGFVRCVQFMARVNSKKSNEPLPSSSKTLKIY